MRRKFSSPIPPHGLLYVTTFGFLQIKNCEEYMFLADQELRGTNTPH